MGHQRRLKQLWREMKQMRRKNQHEELLYFADQYDVFLAEVLMFDKQNAELDPINEEFDELYEIVMPKFVILLRYKL
jgi:5'-deoxynucleotidase YfbR-like HD superfamily hydrolase